MGGVEIGRTPLGDGDVDIEVHVKDVNDGVDAAVNVFHQSHSQINDRVANTTMRCSRREIPTSATAAVKNVANVADTLAKSRHCGTRSDD